MKSLALMALAITSLSSLLIPWVSAVPDQGPGGEDRRGLFSIYFENIANSPCVSPFVIQGFKTTPADYLKANCVNIDTLIGNYLVDNGWGKWTTVTGGISYMGGNVGIGTATPSSALDVNGIAQVGYLYVNPQDAANEGGEIVLRKSSPWLSDIYLDNVGGNFRIFDIEGNNNFFSYAPSGNAYIRWNLGVGVPFPTTKLHVSSTADEVAQFDSTGNPTVSLSQGGTIKSYLKWAGENLQMENLAGGSLYLWTNGNWLTFSSWGNLGIGTFAPNEKLSVAWNIEAISDTSFVWVAARVASNDIYHPYFMGYRTRWTLSSPSYPRANDALSAYVGRDGIDGGTNTRYGGAAMYFLAAENFDGDSKWTNTIFQNTRNGEKLPRETMRLTSSGYVGIGTTVPDKPLHVVTSNANNDGTQGIIVAENTSTTGNVGINLRVNGPNMPAIQFSQWPFKTTMTGAVFGYYMGTVDFPTGFQFVTKVNGAQDTKMVIKYNGDVGIGVKNPGAKLHLSTSADEVARFESSGDPFISLFQSWYRKGYLFESGDNLQLMNEGAGGFFIGTNNSYKLALRSNGNLDMEGEVSAKNGYGNSLYMGGDSAGSDFEIGSLTAGTNTLSFYNRPNRAYMDIIAKWANFEQIKISGWTPGLGKVLTSDASGIASWQNAAGGSALPTGVAGNTLYHNGTNWVASSALYNNGTTIGIGTTTPDPDRKLHIVFSNPNPDGKNGKLVIENTANSINATSAMQFRTANPDAPQWLQFATNSADWLKFNSFGFSNNPAYGGYFFNILNNSVTAMVVNKDSGNVGIGTVTPKYKLEVNAWNMGITDGNWVIRKYNNNALDWPGMIFARGRGSIAGATSSLNGDKLWAIAFTPYNWTDYFLSAEMWAIQSWNSYSDGTPSDLYFTTVQGGTPIERMRITSLGNIGIGTTTPWARLEVAGQIKITGGTPGVGKVLTSDANGLASWATPATGSGWSSLPGGSAGNTLYHNGTAWVASSNFFNNGGNIGIGTATPGEKLEVNGNIKLTGANPTISASTYTEFPWGAWFSDPVRPVYAAGTIRARGGVNDDVNSVLSLFWGTSGNTYVSGNLGVGVAAPTQKLDVAGNVKISGTLQIAGGTPGAGKVLTSNATGVASWETPAAGGGGGGRTYPDMSPTDVFPTYKGLNHPPYWENFSFTRNIGAKCSSGKVKVYVSDREAADWPDIGTSYIFWVGNRPINSAQTVYDQPTSPDNNSLFIDVWGWMDGGTLNLDNISAGWFDGSNAWWWVQLRAECYDGSFSIAWTMCDVNPCGRHEDWTFYKEIADYVLPSPWAPELVRVILNAGMDGDWNNGGNRIDYLFWPNYPLKYGKNYRVYWGWNNYMDIQVNLNASNKVDVTVTVSDVSPWNGWPFNIDYEVYFGTVPPANNVRQFAAIVPNEASGIISWWSEDSCIAQAGEVVDISSDKSSVCRMNRNLCNFRWSNNRYQNWWTNNSTPSTCIGSASSCTVSDVNPGWHNMSYLPDYWLNSCIYTINPDEPIDRTCFQQRDQVWCY